MRLRVWRAASARCMDCMTGYSWRQNWKNAALSEGVRRYTIAALCFVRVPKLCPRPAFLAVLEFVAD